MPLKVSDGIGAYIDDFQKSDAPQFKGKDKKERRDMAIAAYLTAKRGGKAQDEGVVKSVVHDLATTAAKKTRDPNTIRRMANKAATYVAKATENIKTADRKPEIYTKPDGKKGIRMVATDREVVKTEALDAKDKPFVKDLVKKLRGGSKTHAKQADDLEKAMNTEAIKHTHAVVDGSGKVAGMTSNERDAKDIARRHKGKVIKLKKPMSPKKGDMMINRPFKEEVNEEMNFAVSIEGLPTMFMSADSPGMLKQTLRKIVKQPSMIKAVKRVTDAKVKKTFRLKAQGKEEENEE